MLRANMPRLAALHYSSQRSSGLVTRALERLDIAAGTRATPNVQYVQEGVSSAKKTKAGKKKKAALCASTDVPVSTTWQVVKTGVVKPVQLEKEMDRIISIARNADYLRGEWGVENLVGVDEAGRGCWAGSVSVAAASIPLRVVVEGVNDSKNLSAGVRSEVLSAMLAHPDVHIALDFGTPEEIDEHNILSMTRQSMERCVNLLKTKVENFGVLVDGTSLIPHPKKSVENESVGRGSVGRFVGRPAAEIQKGDLLHHCIGAASIVAKTLRDATMHDLQDRNPEFSFLKHKAYGTRAHQEELGSNGPVQGVHRKSFRPMADMTNWRVAQC